MTHNRAWPLYARASELPDKIAIHFEGRQISYAQLAQRTRSFAAGLQRAGIQRHDKVALMIATRPDFIAIQYALLTLGATLVPMNVHYKGHEMVHALETCEVDCLIADAEMADRLPADLAGSCPRLRAVHAFGIPEAAATRWHDAQGLLLDPAEAPDPVEVGADDLPLMLYTSATTGKAKGVMLTAANLEFNYDATPGYLRLSRDEVILCVLPFYNTFGLNQVINATLFLGATMVLRPRFSALDCLVAIEKYRCTFFPSVPMMLQTVLHHPEAERFDLSSLQRFCVGAAPVPGPLLARLRERVGGDAFVINGYGLTEATAIVATNEVVMDAHGQVVKGNSIGKPLPGIDMCILDDAGQPAAPGVVGEICVRGPSVMKGYFRQADATAQALAGGWLHTGDLGTVDKDGYFTIVDRMKDVIIRGGQNIYPADIEEVLYRHPSVAEAAVVAWPDELLGEVPRGFVSLKPNAVAQAEELLALCRQELAYYKVPVAVEIRPELPKGPTGKILRRELRAKPRGVAAS